MVWFNALQTTAEALPRTGRCIFQELVPDKPQYSWLRSVTGATVGCGDYCHANFFSTVLKHWATGYWLTTYLVVLH